MNGGVLRRRGYNSRDSYGYENLLVVLDNEQSDEHLLYFAIYLLHFSTCFEHYMLIIRRLNCNDAASGVVLSVSGRPVHGLRENEVLSQPVHRKATD